MDITQNRYTVTMKNFKCLDKSTLQDAYMGGATNEYLNSLEVDIYELPAIIQEFHEAAELFNETTCAMSACKIGYSLEILRFKIWNTIFGKGVLLSMYGIDVEPLAPERKIPEAVRLL